MTDVLGFAAYLLLPLFGLAVWRLEGVRRLDLAGRIAIAAAVGAVVVPVVLALLSIVGIEWSRTSIFAALAIIAIAGIALAQNINVLNSRRSRASTIAIVLIAAVAIYGLLTARMSSGDLHFFWGPKAILYFENGGLTLAVLKSTLHQYMNPDYPLLVPLLHAWSITVSHHFAWWGALLASGIFLFGSVAVIRSTSGDDAASIFAAAALTYTAAKGCVPGGAEPVLLLFETVALCALTFIEDKRTQTILTAVALAGAAATKIEGTTFAIAVILAMLIVKRDIKRAAIIGTPAAVVFFGWLAFVTSNDLSVVYHAGAMPIYLEALPRTLIEMGRVGAYGLYWLPWLGAIAMILLGNPRRAALPIAAAILTTGATVFFYIHVPDPTAWIVASGPRVFMTPLCCLLVAAAASRRPVLESPTHGVVP
ncbi:MAG TPA: hypothetical protein VGQ76_13940 [Thermoanaerobaculia bacterium]|jgi:hypothetical protein|nr:hypothetical protein [Thermoanaerobaculia bacterium]